MQQKQNRTETSTKKSNGFGQLMLQKDKNRFQMKEKQAYIELLKAPRGKEYVRLLGKIREISEQLADDEEEIKKLQQEIERETGLLPAEVSGIEHTPEETTPVWTVEAPKKSAPVWTTGGLRNSTVSWPDKVADGAGVVQKLEEKKRKLLQLQIEQSRRIEEFQKEQKAFIEQLPAPDKVLGLLWPDSSTEILMKYGVISVPGSSWESPEELLEQVKPRSEQEERQWLKGGNAYFKYIAQYGNNLLDVEVYVDVICVVLMDRSVIVVE